MCLRNVETGAPFNRFDEFWVEFILIVHIHLYNTKIIDNIKIHLLIINYIIITTYEENDDFVFLFIKALLIWHCLHTCCFYYFQLLSPPFHYIFILYISCIPVLKCVHINFYTRIVCLLKTWFLRHEYDEI